MKIAVQCLSLIVGLTALAMPGLAAERPCLQMGQLENWKAMPGNRSVIVTSVAHKKFKITLNGNCVDLQWHGRLAFQMRGRCLAGGDKILPRELEGLSGEVCPIAKVETYTAEMEKADAHFTDDRK